MPDRMAARAASRKPLHAAVIFLVVVAVAIIAIRALINGSLPLSSPLVAIWLVGSFIASVFAFAFWVGSSGSEG